MANRRAFSGAAGATLAGLLLTAAPALAQEYGTPELVEAARKEGKLMVYSANVAETEQPWFAAFNKRFPFINIQLLRAPGGQLITRIQTESSTNKLPADIIDLSDRGVAKTIENLFADYTPPNAKDYPAGSRVSDRLWPRTTAGWCIAYNEALVKNPPKTWKDLEKPEYKGQIGHVIAPSGGTTWTRAMFERQVLGEGHWAAVAKNAPSLYPSNAPASDALVRGEVSIAPLLTNVVLPKIRDGAPLKCVYAPEGVPLTPFAAGIPKTAPSPNAAKLFMNWSLSVEGQTVLVKENGAFSSLTTAPMPDGADPKVVKIWLPDFEQFEKLRTAWIEDWNKTFNYRQ